MTLLTIIDIIDIIERFRETDPVYPSGFNVVSQIYTFGQFRLALRLMPD